MRTRARGALFSGMVAVLALGAACVNATETTQVFASQHRFVAIVRDDVPLTILDLVTRERRELLPAGRCVFFPGDAWSADGSRLLCQGETALLLDPETGEVVNEIRRNAPATYWWCGQHLIAVSYAGEVARMEIRDSQGRVVRSLEGV
ncbi:MAG TPA: hypothetical protein VNN12_00040, partial [Dehalococcoidia bacterium]|nr:hypothetical protein [Dehalococcoidia bacterium]